MPIPFIVLLGAGSALVGSSISSLLDAAEREGEKKGFQYGYRQCSIDMKKKFYETVSQHIAKVCGMYALGFYMALMDDKFDKDDATVIVEVLGSRRLQPEYVQAELDKVINMKQADMNMKVITQKYLNEINAEGLKDCDAIIKELVEAFRRRGSDVSSFYTKIWKPYYNDRV